MKPILLILFIFSFLYSQNYKYTNSLIAEKSPYLLQHAHNPIFWYAWNKKALKKAKDENKLIFLSIGYSTCHWCHVMEKESFEDKNLAKIFNQHYISIKVDREVDVHIDTHYQDILSSFKNRRNGWPLNAILTPDLEVLYITTYIPPVFKYGTAGLDTVLLKYAKIFEDKKELKKLIEINTNIIAQKDIYQDKDANNLESGYINAMSEVYDDGFKGFFKRPRFPQAANLSVLYDMYDLTKDKRAIKMVYEPLDAMARGGIYDQIEGAFYRYSVNPDWIIPHFEKMLYTTAELVPIYTRAYIDTNKELYKDVVVNSLDQIEHRFFKDGLFYSASNADSPNGAEGEYFMYSYEKAHTLLVQNGYTPHEAEYNLEYLDITTIGNFEGEQSNPHYNNNFEDDEEPIRLKETLKILKQIRATKKYPFVDKKIITSWNAMMIKAYLKAGQIDKKYEQKGLEYLKKLLQNSYVKNKLYHYSIEGVLVKQEALLEDYAFLIDTLLYAYSIKYDSSYLELSSKLLKKAKDIFYKNNIWYLDKDLLARANFKDKYYTSPLSLMFENLITLANYKFDMSLLYQTKQMIKNYSSQILSDIANHSSGIRAIIRLQKGDVILKSNKNNLINYKKKIQNIKYPFLYTMFEQSSDFLACDESTCFAYSDNFDKIKNKIIIHIDK
jgi:uncharacterized protein YyaL (SSP411 family)